jgi:peptidyl-prolyl cis-trans isomerase C
LLVNAKRLAVCFAAAFASTSAPLAADDAGQSAVVARVGAAVITVRDLQERMRALPDFQLATLGGSLAEIRRRFLEEVLVREALFAEGARARHLADTEPVRQKIKDALRLARLHRLREETTVGADEVAAYFVDNHARFDSPARISIARILAATRTDADALLAQARARPGLAAWNELARDRSLDKATAMRGGNLGFVAADGSSSEVTLKVDPALFAAAERVKDGELVPEPVSEGSQFAVVWRRGSVPAVHRTLDQEANAIRQILARQKLNDAVHALREQLRRDAHVETKPEVLDVLEVNAVGEVAPRKRAPATQRPPAAPPEPSTTPRGLR